ncbi:hypothetical protein SDC9_52162 [bioreactor metagenome]|uniref:Uncharacterized protein n=1 Tax=bioreactor metagenome TaxID=1076179 RepID=A0A644WQE3_9ZZZZ
MNARFVVRRGHRRGVRAEGEDSPAEQKCRTRQCEEGCTSRFQQQPRRSFRESVPEVVFRDESVFRNGKDEAWPDKVFEGNRGDVTPVAAEVKKSVAVGAGMKTAGKGVEVEVRSPVHVEDGFQLRFPVAGVDRRREQFPGDIVVFHERGCLSGPLQGKGLHSFEDARFRHVPADLKAADGFHGVDVRQGGEVDVLPLVPVDPKAVKILVFLPPRGGLDLLGVPRKNDFGDGRDGPEDFPEKQEGDAVDVACKILPYLGFAFRRLREAGAFRESVDHLGHVFDFGKVHIEKGNGPVHLVGDMGFPGPFDGGDHRLEGSLGLFSGEL